MFEQSSQSSRQQEQGEMAEQKKTMADTGTDPFVMAAAASVVLSQWLYFMKGNRELGIFVGLWPPTFMAFGSHYAQKEMKNKLEFLTSSRGLMKTIERAVSGKK